MRTLCTQHGRACFGPVTVTLTLLALLISAVAISAGEFHHAIAAGDLARVKALLKGNPQLVTTPDENDRFSSLPLHLAAMSGNVEIARLLIEAGADIECGDTDESTPLDVAAMNHHPEMVAFLISQGANVNRRDKNGAYPVSFATSAGDSAIVGMLIRAGADLNLRDANGCTLLHFALSPSMRGLLDVLIARGDDPNVAAVDGTTPLHLAAGRGNLEAVEALLAAGADHSPRDQHNLTPLFTAAMRNRGEVVRRLIAAGADPNAADQAGNQVIIPAVWTGSQDAVQALIDNGADVNAVGSTGETAIISAVKQGTTGALQMLISAGADVNIPEPHFGATPLHMAATRGYKDAAQVLLAGGANVNARTEDGATALDLASNYGHRDVADLLIAAGAGGSPVDFDAGTLAAQSKISRGEAVVWYLNHSGYAVKTKNHLLVFDYFNPGPSPAAPGLCNGFVNPRELAGQDVMVLVSHEHADHFSPIIFDWRQDIPKITYVLGCRPDSAPSYEFMGPREVRTIDGVKITTIDSNDPGVGFWVEVDDLVIFHAGDHANRWLDFSGPYREEIDYLAATGKRPDIAFMPVSGCGFGDPEAVKLGVLYALDTLKPRVFMPMHSGGSEYRYKEFVADCRDKCPAVQMVAPMAGGDRFHYRDGQMTLAEL